MDESETQNKLVLDEQNLPLEKTKKKEINLKKEYGIDDINIFDEIINNTVRGLPHYATLTEKSRENIIRAIKEMKPSDAIEAKLCAKEASLYSLAMQYVKRAEAGMFSEESDMGSRMWYETNMNFAIKLLRLHNETVETLNRYRRKGEQKVIVQHVNVEGGSQAIVNNGNMGGGIK